MNKPTREQIEHRAVEIMLNSKAPMSCDFCKYRDVNEPCWESPCVMALMETALEKAEEDLLNG